MNIQTDRLMGSAVLAIGIFVGLNFHSAAHLLAPLALPALFVVATFSMVPLATYSRAQIFTISPVMWRVVTWQQIILPTLILFLGLLTGADETLLLFVLITATAGSLFAAPAIVNLLELDNLHAIQGVVLSTMFTPVSLYIFMTIYHGVHAEIDLLLFLERIVIFLGLPAAFLGLCKIVSDHMTNAHRSALDRASRWVAILALIVFGIAMMDPVTFRLHEDPSQILLYLFTATSVGVVMHLLTMRVFRSSGPKQSHTAGILTGFRNVGLSFGLIGDMIGSEFAVYVGVAMLPTFIAPFLLNIVMSRSKSRKSDIEAAGQS